MASNLVAAFMQFDEDNDGTISAEELTKVLSKLKLGDDEIEELLVSADTNQDGSISYEEFIAWVTNDDGGREIDQKLDRHRIRALGELNWQAQVSVPIQYSNLGTTELYPVRKKKKEPWHNSGRN